MVHRKGKAVLISKTKETGYNRLDECILSAKEEAQRQIDSGLIQGVVFTESRSRMLVSLGKQRIHPTEKTMTPDSRFDMASVGKVFTAGCCALLIAQGKLEPDAPFVHYLPEYWDHNSNITVRDLAMHVGGFDNSKAYDSDDIEVFHRELFLKHPVRPRLQEFEYACSNFILLGKIAEKLTGMDLDALARKLIWEPLEMRRTQWNAPGDGPDEVEHWHPNRPAGQHNDSTCFHCGFPIGNGSCFSTAGDMLLFLEDILEKKHFPPIYYNLILTCGFEKDGNRRSFGWDMRACNRPQNLSEHTIYHTGFTGQTICLDPEKHFAAVVLTSRTGDHAEAIHGRARIIEKLFSSTPFTKPKIVENLRNAGMPQ